MADTPRLNGVIAALEQGKAAFVSFCAAEIGVAQAMNTASYDGVVFEMEHRPYDIRALRDCLQYMLDRRQILQRGTLAPAVTPFVRIPPNGGEASQWVGKQVLDQGVYGILWPALRPVAEARIADIVFTYSRTPARRYQERRSLTREGLPLSDAGAGLFLLGAGARPQSLRPQLNSKLRAAVALHGALGSGIESRGQTGRRTLVKSSGV